jgi:hypothetical protein
MGRRSNALAPYFIHMREFERRLLRDALEAAGGNTELVATTLGVGIQYIYARSMVLGGIFPGKPKREPPGSTVEAFNKTSAHGRSPSKQPETKTRRPHRKKEKPSSSTVIDENATSEVAVATSEVAVATPEVATDA